MLLYSRRGRPSSLVYKCSVVTVSHPASIRSETLHYSTVPRYVALLYPWCSFSRSHVFRRYRVPNQKPYIAQLYPAILPYSNRELPSPPVYKCSVITVFHPAPTKSEALHYPAVLGYVCFCLIKEYHLYICWKIKLLLLLLLHPDCAQYVPLFQLFPIFSHGGSPAGVVGGPPGLHHGCRELCRWPGQHLAISVPVLP